ncbi:MAG: glycosyltransferase family 4 protein, partial [Pyrinomonadaceae bacterium]
MDKVAIIVQRCHQSVVGGSETLAWQYATMLKDSYEVDILTTTALDSDEWSNSLPEGPETSDCINIRRFHIDISQNRYGSELLRRWLQNSDRSTNGSVRRLPWPISLQEELIRQLGPYSDSLTQFLRTHWSDYKKIIVFTYLYPTAYFSLLEIPKGRALFVPTLHDEEIAYLSVYKHAARRAKMLIWLTNAEREFGLRLWGDLPGRIVSPAIDTIPRAPFRSSEPYVLYCGRIDAGKGCQELVDYFIKFKQENESPLRLILTGSGGLAIPAHPNIEFRGVASPEEKFSLMSGATIFITPSDKESFSIVTLEAMAQGTPVLVNGASQVLVDHINSSEAGLIYHDYESFSSNLQALLSNEVLRTQLGESGKRYVHSRYTYESVRQTLIEVIETPDLGETLHQVQRAKRAPSPLTKNRFRHAFTENLVKCDWSPHPLYSVFTQYDRDYYLRQKDDFMHKYRCFYAVSKTISPEKIIE